MQNKFIIVSWVFHAESGDTDLKKYFIPHHLEAVWSNARSICQSYGMDYLSMDSEDEYKHVLQLLKDNAASIPQWLYIGAITKEARSKNHWYWVSSGNHITFPLNWAANQPNNHPPSKEYCMTFEKQGNNNFLIHDCPCNVNLCKFICQQKNEPYDMDIRRS